ncbi:hypothetical protein AA14337_0190 [Acetobacter malorum DSM 14337]|uniref:Uncharacterized protein n=1 Tax=Acetobacter malorum DSM 14337 TaxID=1307910 RepID=A0ABQ0PLJ6_9PROT|nr:hypothetical protein [Acetobacter malorum]KXV06167.1 hypothetical protein AD930_08765 [Acetobacter malorum]GBQ75305.1 hypothetical protein AA14337_0190 [Acetobacter malorum DSM 14337]
MSTLLDFSAAVATGGRGNTLSGGQIVDVITGGTPLTTIVNPGANCALSYVTCGDNGYRIMPDTDCSLTLTGGQPGQIQIMRILIIQSPAGNSVVTWPSNVIWPDGVPFVDSRSGAVMCAEIMFDGDNHYYGRRIFG